MCSLDIHFTGCLTWSRVIICLLLMYDNVRDNASVSVWKYTISSSDLMVLSKCEICLLVTSYSSCEFEKSWESVILIMKNMGMQGHEKLSWIWKYLGKFIKLEKPSTSSLSVLVHQLKIKYTVPVGSRRYFWSVSYQQSRWVCIYHCLSFHHILMLNYEAALYLEWYLVRLH